MPAVISVTRTIIGTIVGIVCTSMVAYTLSRRDFVLRKPFQLLFVVTMYVSGGMIPEYLLIIRTLKLGNNFMVYILPGLMWVYNMILVRSYYRRTADGSAGGSKARRSKRFSDLV